MTKTIELTSAGVKASAVLLRGHSNLDGVAIYYCPADDRFYYSRDGGTFSPKGGEGSLAMAEVTADENYVKQKASKRVVPKLTFAVYSKDGACGYSKEDPIMFDPGQTCGYGLGSGRVGLLFKREGAKDKDPLFLQGGAFGGNLIAFLPGDPSIARIQSQCFAIDKLTKHLGHLESLRAADVEENGSELPAEPDSKEARVAAEDELRKIVAGMKLPELRTFKVGLVDKEADYYESPCPRKWDRVEGTSVHAIVADHFGSVAWVHDWRYGPGGYSRTVPEKIREMGKRAWGFVPGGSSHKDKRQHLVIVDTTEAWPAEDD